MTTTQNKTAIGSAFNSLSQGDGRPFVDLMADDFTWIFKGSTNWRGRYSGKAAVQETLLAPLFANFSGIYTNTAHRIIAEDDVVVVECEGNVTTKAGERYNNRYCYVIRMADGKMSELTEYMDTALADRVLLPPRHG